MPPVHKTSLERSISRLNQTAYGTPRASGDSYRRIISEGYQTAKPTTAFENDAGRDNGSDVASDTWATTVDAQAAFSPDFNFQDIGYFLKDFLGTYSVSGAGPYIHLFTPQDMSVSRQMPSRTVLEKHGALRLRRLDDMVGKTLTISGGRMGRLKVSGSYGGSGDYADDPASYTSPAVTDDREYGYSSQAFFRINEAADGVAQVETVTFVGSPSATGNVNAVVTAAGLTNSPVTVPVALTSGDTAAQAAEKVRVALRKNIDIDRFMGVSGSSAAIVGTARVRVANDATFNIAIDDLGLTGVTAVASSTNTTAGVVGDYQSYTCAIEEWTLTINNPSEGDGYRPCSDYVVAGIPTSGQTRSEDLVGAREYKFEFTVRQESADKLRGWMQAGSIVSLEIPIIGTDAGNSSLRMVHTKAKVIMSEEEPDIGGFFGIKGALDLLSNSGSIPFTATLTNDVASYAS